MVGLKIEEEREERGVGGGWLEEESLEGDGRERVLADKVEDQIQIGRN